MSFFLGLDGAFGGKDVKHGRSYGDEMKYALDVQGHRQPQWLAQEAEFGPQWQDLAMGQWGSALLGKDGAKAGGGVAGRGMLDVFLKTIAPALRGAQSEDRAADVGDVEALAPRVRDAQRSLNPDVASIIDLLTGGAKANLQNGLGAGERRELQQAIRGAQASRGVGYGPSDTFEEVYGVGREAENIKAERAMRAIGASQGFYGDPFSMLLSRGGVGTVAAGGALNLPGYIQQTSGGKYFNPESGYMRSIAQGEQQTDMFNAKMQKEWADHASQTASTIMGGAMGGK